MLIKHSTKFNDWLNRQTIRKIQKKANSESRPILEECQQLLENERFFIDDKLSTLLDDNEWLNLRKKELLHKRWTDKVYAPLESKINEEMKGEMYKELKKRKRQLYREYLEHLNKKGHVFLDVVSADEYYPLSLHPTRPSLLVARTANLKDPLHSQQRQRTREQQLVLQCTTGERYPSKVVENMRLPPIPATAPLGRHTTTHSHWLSTPVLNVESDLRKASQKRMRGIATVDSGVFRAAWGTSNPDEMKLQKKRKFPEKAVPVRPVIKTVIDTNSIGVQTVEPQVE